MHLHRCFRCRTCRTRPFPPQFSHSAQIRVYCFGNVIEQLFHDEKLYEVYLQQFCRGHVLSSYVFLHLLLFLWFALLSGTDADVVGADDCLFEFGGSVFYEAAEQVELVGPFGGLGGYVPEKQQLGFSHLIPADFFVVVFFVVAFGDLGVLLFDLIDFGDVDEGDVLLPVDFLEFEALVDGRTGLQVEAFFYEGQLHALLLLTTLSHYYLFYPSQTTLLRPLHHPQPSSHSTSRPAQNSFTIIILIMKKEKARPKEIYLQRVKCDCMAQKHELINNCLNCGKIVCAQEGEGNCLYCGKLVTRPDGLFIDDTTTYFPSLTPEQQQQVSAERSRAIQHKNRLIERDKTQGQQNIFDEQLDYYEISENKWLDQEDRQHAIDKILAKGNLVETQQFKTNAKYDPLTGEFVREDFQFDEEAFKKEGQTFLEAREREDKEAKELKAKDRHHWDERVFNSEKMKDICVILAKDRPEHPPPEQFLSKKPVKGITETLVE